MKRILLLVSILAIIAACTHKPFTVDNTTPSNNNTQTQKDTTKVTVDTSVCFQRDVLPIFIGSCAKAGCHDAATNAKGYTLTSYSKIILKGLVKYNSAGSKLYTKCVSGSMPKSPTPKLDSTQLSYIRRWIDKGAPNDTNCMVICDTGKFTYSGAIAPMMKKYCYGCHATAVAASSGAGIILDTYTGIYAQAHNGKLYGDMNHNTGYNAMPLGGSKLTDCQITQVKKWIDAGALNN